MPDPASDPAFYVNRRVGKFFEGSIYFGSVSHFDLKAKLWQIDYDDGDEEEFDKTEILTHINIYESHKDLDKKS